MTISEAQQYMNDSNSGKITWDDNGRAAANNVLGGATPKLPTLDYSQLGMSATDFANTLNNTEMGALGEYTKAIQSQPSSLSTYNQQLEAAGVPALKKQSASLTSQINDTEDAIGRVEANIRSNTGNSLATESQIQGMTTEAKKPLQESLTKANTAAGRVAAAISSATADASNRTQLILSDQQRALLPYEKKLEIVSNQAARLMSGFTADRQAKLDILTANFNAGVQLTMEQMREAADLMKQEQDYQNNVKLIQAKGTQADTQVIEVGGRKKLINMQTGEMKDLGASGSGTSSFGISTKTKSYIPGLDISNAINSSALKSMESFIEYIPEADISDAITGLSQR